MMNTSPRVSIGLAVYNGENFLAQAIECFLAQSYTDFELIISDNASTDRTPKICREYAARDARIRYYRHHVNRGANWNLNRVFKLARGELFKWAAHDDLCAPTFIERCVEALDDDPSVVWCHAITASIGADGQIIPESEAPTKAARGEVCRSPRAHARFRDVLLTSTHWGYRCSGLFRADVLRRTQLFRPYYGSEKILCAEVALAGRYYQVPQTLFFQRVHEDASSALETARQQQEFACPDRPVALPRLAILRGYLGVALSPGMSPPQRCWSLLWVVCYMFQFRKWPRVFGNFLLGRALGAGKRHRSQENTPRHSMSASAESSSRRRADGASPVAAAKR